MYSTSKKRFAITGQSDPIDFLSWFLNKTNIKSTKTGLMTDLFQGELRIEEDIINDTNISNVDVDMDSKKTVKILPFMFLTLDLPLTPLFQDEFERNIIPQISIDALLMKYDGSTLQLNGNISKT